MKRALTLIILVALAACDSNGGAIVPASAPPADPGTGTTITSANAASVSGAAWGAVNNSADMVGLIGNSGLIASNPGNVNKAAQDLVTKASIGDILQGVPIGPLTLDCVIPGGTATIDGDIFDVITPTLTADDVIIVDYNNCDDGLGEVLDGLLEMTIVSFTGDMLLGPYDLVATLRLKNFQVTTAADSILTNGTATASLDTSDPANITASVSGASMITDTNTYSETLTNFDTAQTVNTVDQFLPYTINASGTLDNSQLDGVVSYTTGPQFTGNGLDFPGSGSLLISTVGSAARLTAIDNVNVTIDIDNDGDGVYDEMINTTWAAITN